MVLALLDAGEKFIIESRWRRKVHNFASQVIDLSPSFASFADFRGYNRLRNLRRFPTRWWRTWVSLHPLRERFAEKYKRKTNTSDPLKSFWKNKCHHKGEIPSNRWTSLKQSCATRDFPSLTHIYTATGNRLNHLTVEQRSMPLCPDFNIISSLVIYHWKCISM